VLLLAISLAGPGLLVTPAAGRARADATVEIARADPLDDTEWSGASGLDGTVAARPAGPEGAEQGLGDDGFDAAAFVSPADRRRAEEAARWQRWLIVASGVLAGLAALLAAGNWGLRRAVGHATQRLKAIEAQQRALIEASPDAMMIIDRDGTCLLANSITARRLGTTLAELVGTNIFNWLSDNATADRRHRLHEAIDRQRIVSFLDEHKGRWLENTIVPVSIYGSDHAMAAVFARDVTDWHDQEQRLRRAYSEAEQATRAKTRFLAAAAHDLRQPAQAAMLFYQLLPDQRAEDDPDGIRERLGNSLENLQELLKALLDISKLDTGMIAPIVQPMAVDPMLERLWMEFAPLAESRGTEIRRVPSSAWVESDPTLLTTMLRNLLTNAVTYARDGQVLIGCRGSGRRLRLMVCDTGLGIDQSDQALIFEEFYRAQQVGHDRAKGLGLGLAVVRRMADLLGHEVAVCSQVGRGSIFEIIVDRATAGVQEEKRAGAPPQIMSSSRDRLIAVIDDHPDVLESLRLYYLHLGHEVVAAICAEGAIEQLCRMRRSPDVIVADWHILSSGVNGHDAIREIRKTFGADIPAILLTGDSSAEIADAVDTAGLFLLQKPVQSRELAAALDQLLAD
jgi:PAS domain S-box-containing protein